MKFGVREICNVVFKAKDTIKIGTIEFKKGQPVLYIDSAKTSTIEGSATTVYATGGRGNARLVTWEGDKTLTFTVEDALISPISFSMLSGAGLVKPEKEKVFVHKTATAKADSQGVIILEDALATGEMICSSENAKVYCSKLDEDDSIVSAPEVVTTISGKTITCAKMADSKVFVDFYVEKNGTSVSELQIDAEHFGGYFYVEASTLFRQQSTGSDLPAEITIPKVKIQSNFTFSMAATGDPSTFTFTMDAMPDYTYFNKNKKVLCVIQLVEDSKAQQKEVTSVMLSDVNASI